MKNKQDILNAFSNEFTQIVEYTKWPDEHIAQFTGREIVWKDIVKNNPNHVRSWLLTTLTEFERDLMERATAVYNLTHCDNCQKKAKKLLKELEKMKKPKEKWMLGHDVGYNQALDDVKNRARELFGEEKK